MQINLSHKKFVLLNDYLPFGSADVDTFTLLRFLSHPDNIGNIVFLDAINRSLPGIRNVSSRDFIRFREQFSADHVIVLALANFLSATWTAPEGFVEALAQHRIVLFSVGVQSEFGEEDSICLSRDAQAVLDLARTSGTLIGVRGDKTQRYLARSGIASQVIGCPSVHLAPERIACDKPLGRARVCTSNTMLGIHRDIAKRVNTFATKFCSGYMLQTEASIIADCMELPEEVIGYIADQSGNPHHAGLLRNKVFDYGYYNEDPEQWKVLRAWFKEHARFHYTVADWRAYAAGFDYCIGTRFHGNVMALQAGVPPLIIPIDSRVADMAEFHRLPRVSMEDFEQIRDVTELAPYLDFTDYNDHHTSNKKLYFQFLKENFR
ncbi:polysaccharide pyruvyl transferase family protein [Massilia sp. IC2-477]|uniref:polysaccharide pyruvyl transferase family protein n=1 Tax=Massilia sp. IC2-477 TaxID=2887198 RepID=UPI001D10870E|nr:polysaccharide pyruvyl transferase family protein [Massilia sp. IC2-477]MCC2957039.1 polysaccharide pyruvyl transferase family protein [Massilia sp. IC2-477]